MTDNNMKGGMTKMNNCGYGCYAVSASGSNRGFLTKEEKIEMLEEYKKDLESEAKGVMERIAELRKEK